MNAIIISDCIASLDNGKSFLISENCFLANSYSCWSNVNLAIENSEDNTTISIRKSFQEFKFIDIYSSNSYSFIDMGQLQRSSSQKYGLRVGIIF